MNLRNAFRNSIVVAALTLVPLAAFADEAAKTTREASIPFANHGGIRDWQADRDRGVWIQDVHGKWFYAALLSPCTGLNFANSIGFDTRPLGSFDRFSFIVVPQQGRCAVRAFAPSGAPPRKGKDNRPANLIESTPKS